MALCRPRDGAGREPQAAPRGAVGLREHQRNLVPGGNEGVERARGERGSARERDAQGALQAALRWRFLSFVRTRFCLSSER